jgi:FtsH-binding integral membrane protein
MSSIGSWIVGGIVGLLGLIGLFLASRAVDGAIYGFGVLLFVFAVLFNFWLVKRHYDAIEDE